VIVFLRSLLFNIAFFGWSTICTFAFLPRLFGTVEDMARALILWGRGIDWLLAHICRITVEIRGREYIPTEPALVVAKHQSAWETISLHALLDKPAFVVKKELLSIPLAGMIVRGSGAIAVDRSAGSRALKAMLREAREAVRAGRPVVIFPEGTRRPVGAPPAYQPGVAALYAQLNLPAVPVALNSGLFWARRSFIKRPGRIIVEFLPPIAPGLDRRAFLAEIEARIETATEALIAETLDRRKGGGDRPQTPAASPGESRG